MAKSIYNDELRKTSCESIIEAMLMLLQSKKYSEISITEIAEKAGVSRNAIYRNFETKEQIVVAHLHKLTENFKSEVQSQSFGDYRSYLISVFTHLKNTVPI